MEPVQATGTRSDSERSEHICQLYSSDVGLVTSVQSYVISALALNEAVLFIARNDHDALYRRSLASAGVDVDRVVSKGQLLFVGAEELAERVMRGPKVDAQRLRSIILDLLSKAHVRGRYPHVHVFGELVDLLWRQGNTAAAVKVEGLWNDLQRTEPFTRYCALYVARPDDERMSGPIQDVLRAHTYVVHTPTMSA